MKEIKRSVSLISKLNLFNSGAQRRFRPILFFLALTFLTLPSCTNNTRFGSLNLGNGNGVVAPPPNSGTSVNGSNSSFTLSRVIKNTLNPTSQFDLVGDGSGAFGNLCVSTGAAGAAVSSTSPTVCECNFSYDSVTQHNASITTPVIYHETNLLRCSYANIPADVSKVSVSINLTSVGTTSNIVNITLSGTGASIDLTNPQSFIKPQRYQCRDIVFIPYIFDGTVYDPIQSEDPLLSYPIDFYASNLVDALNAFVNSGQAASWNCPPILNPTNYLTTNALESYNRTNHLNLNLYSEAPLPGGGNLIFPPDGAIDRSTFYLAKSQAGAFSVPVNATIAPTIVSSFGSAGRPPPLGFGANPIPIGSGTGQETCDTSVTIPVGFHWMKLWLFRAGLSPRHYAKSGTGGASIADIGGISCNPGEFPQVATGASPVPAFAGCDIDHTHSVATDGFAAGTSYSMKDLTTTHYLADRRFESPTNLGACFHFDNTAYSPGGAGDGLGPVCQARTGTNLGTSDDTLAGIDLASGGAQCSSTQQDIWIPEASRISGIGCQAAPLFDPLHACSNAGPTYPRSNFDVGVGDDIDKGAGSARYDFVFVVTPPTVNVADMQDTSNTSVALPYIPFRFFTDESCTSANPNEPAPSDCLAINKMASFGVKLHDVGTNGDPPGDDTTRTGTFPVCVLQPDPT